MLYLACSDTCVANTCPLRKGVVCPPPSTSRLSSAEVVTAYVSARPLEFCPASCEEARRSIASPSSCRPALVVLKGCNSQEVVPAVRGRSVEGIESRAALERRPLEEHQRV